jgi:hypothetical protein
MKTIVFDIGGVLRARKVPGLKWFEKARNYDAIRALYSLCVGSPNWRVIIITWKPKAQANLSFVRGELKKLKLAEPDEIIIVTGKESPGAFAAEKRKHYAELKPDIVIDDELACVDAAVQEGATTLRVR